VLDCACVVRLSFRQGSGHVDHVPRLLAATDALLERQFLLRLGSTSFLGRLVALQELVDRLEPPEPVVCEESSPKMV